MATLVAAQNGNWSAGATWTGGTKPGPGDTAQTGNFIVTIDEDITVATLEPTGSGNFTVTAARTITANVVMSSTYIGGGLRCTHAGGTVTLNGNAIGGSAGTAMAVMNFSTGTLIINGATTGGSGASAYGAQNLSTGTLTITTATAGAGTGAHGAYNAAAGTLVVTTAIGSHWGPGGSGSGIANGVFGTGASSQLTTVKAIQSGAYGCAAIGGCVFIVEDSANNTAQFRESANGDTTTLVHSSTTCDYPAESDVRLDVSYADDDMTGSCAVPAADQVAAGIAVDDTTGTAVITPAGLLDAIGLNAANLQTELENIPGFAAVEVWDLSRAGHDDAGSFGAVTEWAGGTAPTAEDIADAVWDEAASGHLTAGSAGKALNDAGAASDPWAAELPGSYAAGEAGYILGTNLDAKVSAVSGSPAGSGAVTWTYTLTEAGTGDPIAAAEVWVTSDPDGDTVIAGGLTDAAGLVTFYLDAGTVYVWRQKPGWNFANPDTEIVA